MASFRFLPEKEDQDIIKAFLLDMIQTRKSDEFYTNPIIEPTLKFFPELERSNSDCVWYACRRLLDYAGLTFLKPKITLVNLVNNSPYIPATFNGIENNECHFTVSKAISNELLGLVGVLAHEVAHVYRRYYHIEHDDSELEEQFTDLTTIYLGFGVLSTRASYLIVDTHFESYYSVVGYLSSELLSFGLAFQALLRGYTSLCSIPYLKHLGGNQRALFKESLNTLLENREELVDFITENRTAAKVFRARVITEIPQMDIEEDEVDESPKAVYAYPFDNTTVWGIKAFVVSLLIGLVLNFIFCNKLLLIASVGIGPFIGIFLSDLKKTYVCSNTSCSKALDLTQEKCPICGGIIETVSVKDKDGFTHQVPREEWLQKFNNQQ